MLQCVFISVNIYRYWCCVSCEMLLMCCCVCINTVTREKCTLLWDVFVDTLDNDHEDIKWQSAKEKIDVTATIKTVWRIQVLTQIEHDIVMWDGPMVCYNDSLLTSTNKNTLHHLFISYNYCYNICSVSVIMYVVMTALLCNYSQTLIQKIETWHFVVMMIHYIRHMHSHVAEKVTYYRGL